MKAALVTAFDTPPRCTDVPDAVASGPDDLVVDVLAAGLHPRVRSQASGSHYTSDGVLPLVPGIDGVGRDPDGRLRYFVLPDTALGAMAEQTVVDARRSVLVPEDADPVALAAAMNPAMSSWVALRRRIDLVPHAQVLVLGATGSAGSLAVQVSKNLGADRVIAAGRDAAKLATLESLGADELIALDGTDGALHRLGAASAEVDVVLDYLWGAPTESAMVAVVTDRADRGKPLSWVQIGSVAGPTAQIPSAALRAARLQLVGSGQGSVSTRDIVAELGELAGQVAAGTFVLDTRVVPLRDVERAWTDAAISARRIVITP